MTLSKQWGNNRPEIEYTLISTSYLLYLILFSFLLIAIFPVKSMAQYGKISGYVYRYANSAPMKDVTVTAFDVTNIQVGSDKTNSSGYFEIIELPPDDYRVCAKRTGYVTECYQKPNPSDPNGCSGKDCGYYWIADPNETQGSLVSVVASLTTSNINFYIARGGSIEGDISGADDDFSYRIILAGKIEYKNSKSWPVEFLLNIEDDHFSSSSVIPPGKYTLRAEDSSPTYPYYYTVYYDGGNGTYIPDDATNLNYALDQTTKYTANFTIKRGGFIRGRVMEKFKGKFVGLSEARVSVTEKIIGFSQSTETNEIYIDPNDGTIYKGLFVMSGLPPGTYILKADDGFITDPNLRIYLPEWYNNVYFEDQATPITITEAQINDPDYDGVYLEIILQHGPVIKGWAIEHEPGQCDSNQYAHEKALEGITIEVIPHFQAETKFNNTDPNGRYIFRKSEKILPGTYDIRAKDTSFSYKPSDFYELTVAPNEEYILNFCLEKIQPGGKGNISGHIFQNEDRNIPLSGINIRAVNITPQDPEFNDATTNNNGEYFFNDMDPGEYIIFTSGNYGDLILELYKDVCLLDPEVFAEGEIIQGVGAFITAATSVFLYPDENITGIDLGISSYNYTFGSGLNLFGYPGLPVQKYDDSHEFCSELGNDMDNFRWKNPETGNWYVITSNLEGNPIQLRTGQGYMIYMENQVSSVFFPPFKAMPPASYQLSPGKNFIAYPSSLHRPIKKSSELLSALGTPEEVASVQSFDNVSGKWKSTVWLWGKPAANDFPIVQGEGYIVGMKVYQTINNDPPNIP